MQRMTKQRQAVLDELTRVNDFRSAQQIFEDLHLQGQRVGLATVYRSLQSLAEDGRVDTLRSSDGEARRTTTITTWCAASAVSPRRSSSRRSSRGWSPSQPRTASATSSIRWNCLACAAPVVRRANGAIRIRKGLGGGYTPRPFLHPTSQVRIGFVC